MTQKERHIVYVDRLVKRVDEAGKGLTDEALERMAVLMKASKGNVAFFLRLVHADRQRFVRRAMKRSFKDFTEVGKIGLEFAKTKVSNV